MSIVLAQNLAQALHLLGVVIWVGGMFFTHMALRPVAMSQLEPAQRLPLFVSVFRRFFFWVWLSIFLILTSGYWMLFAIFGGFATAAIYLHIMSLTGLIMVTIFIYIYFMLYPRLRNATAGMRWSEAATALGSIRKLVLTNLLLGLLTILFATLGKLFV